MAPKHRWRYALAVLLLAAVPFCSCASESENGPVVTKHQVRTADRVLNYTAEVGRIAIRDVLDGQAHGYIFYVAYRMASNDARRPVTFFWGGGPGGTAINMDVEIAGPLRGDGPQHLGPALVPNEDTWLADTDLVFVDAVGTGFSRPAKAEYIKEFMSTPGDTASFTEFIRTWRIQHNAEDAPVYIGGQSWGAPRAATVAYKLVDQGIPLRGVVMITGETSLNKPYLPPIHFEAFRVIGMADVAARHGRTPGDLETLSKHADAWIRTRYIPALENLSSLSEAEKDSIAADLSRFTGFPRQDIDRKTLIITPAQFRKGLLKDSGKTLYGSDTRLVQSLHASYEENYLKRIRHDFGYEVDLPYLTITANVPNSQIGRLEKGYTPFGKPRPLPVSNWDYSTSKVPQATAKALLQAAAAYGGGPPVIGTPLPATAETIERDPGVRFLIILGRYDGSSTCGSNDELQRRLPRNVAQAMTFRCYDSGHSPSRTPGTTKLLHEDVLMLISSTKDRQN